MWCCVCIWFLSGFGLGALLSGGVGGFGGVFFEDAVDSFEGLSPFVGAGGAAVVAVEEDGEQRDFGLSFDRCDFVIVAGQKPEAPEVVSVEMECEFFGRSLPSFSEARA
jgi:hypothetical protein